MRTTSTGLALAVVLLLSLGVVMLAVVVAPPETGADPPAGKPAGRPRDVPDQVLVRFQPGATGAAMAAAHAAIGATIVKTFDVVDRLHLVRLGGGVDVKQAIARYARNPNVLYAEPNWMVQAVEV